MVSSTFVASEARTQDRLYNFCHGLIQLNIGIGSPMGVNFPPTHTCFAPLATESCALRAEPKGAHRIKAAPLWCSEQHRVNVWNMISATYGDTRSISSSWQHSFIYSTRWPFAKNTQSDMGAFTAWTAHTRDRLCDSVTGRIGVGI
jgi:hypothetical protein